MKTKAFMLLIAVAFCNCLIAQEKETGFVNLQGILVKFEDADPIYGGSVTFGIRIKKLIGVGANMQVMKFKNDKNFLVPACFELSISESKKKVHPFFNFQIGQAIYSNTIKVQTPQTSFDARIVGGLFLSPGGGIILPVKNYSGIIFSVSYVNCRFSTTSSSTTRSGTTKTSSKNNLEGFKVGLGLKL